MSLPKIISGAEYKRLSALDDKVDKYAETLKRIERKKDKREYTTIKHFNPNSDRFVGTLAHISNQDEFRFLLEDHKREILEQLSEAKTPEEQIAVANQLKGFNGFIDKMNAYFLLDLSKKMPQPEVSNEQA